MMQEGDRRVDQQIATELEQIEAQHKRQRTTATTPDDGKEVSSSAQDDIEIAVP